MGLVSTTTLNPSAVGNGDSRPVILRVGALQVNVSLPFPDLCSVHTDQVTGQHYSGLLGSWRGRSVHTAAEGGGR